MDGAGSMPYAFALRYHSRTPASSPECKLSLRTRLSRDESPEGEPVDVNVELENLSPKGLATAVAIVGFPGGLEARADQLKELVRERKVDAFETRGREVILYWRALAPEEVHRPTLRC